LVIPFHIPNRDKRHKPPPQLRQTRFRQAPPPRQQRQQRSHRVPLDKQRVNQNQTYQPQAIYQRAIFANLAEERTRHLVVAVLEAAAEGTEVARKVKAGQA
jgi:hypothetical protein